MAQILAALAIISRVVAIVHIVLFALFVGKAIHTVREFNAKLDSLRPGHSTPVDPGNRKNRRDRRRSDAVNDTPIKASQRPVDASAGEGYLDEVEAAQTPLPPVPAAKPRVPVAP